mgnify:FL=1
MATMRSESSSDSTSTSAPRINCKMPKPFHQYSCRCRPSVPSHRLSVIRFRRLSRIVSACAQNPRQYSIGRQVCTAPHSGQRQRFIHNICGYPSKYRLTYPCPQSLTPQHFGHRDGRRHQNAFPALEISVQSTDRYTIRAVTPWYCCGDDQSSNSEVIPFFIGQSNPRLFSNCLNDSEKLCRYSVRLT